MQDAALLRRGATEDPELDTRRETPLETLRGYWAPRTQSPAGVCAVALGEEKLVGLRGRQVPAGRAGNCRRMRVA